MPKLLNQNVQGGAAVAAALSKLVKATDDEICTSHCSSLVSRRYCFRDWYGVLGVRRI